jgi:hypothetical protein
MLMNTNRFAAFVSGFASLAIYNYSSESAKSKEELFFCSIISDKKRNHKWNISSVEVIKTIL